MSEGTIYSIYSGTTWTSITGLEKKIYVKKKLTITPEVLEKEYNRGQTNILKNITKVIDKEDEKSEHWLWNLKIGSDGYGSSNFLRHETGSHKKSWQCFNKKLVPSDLWVLHKCKFKNCVNPDHLSVGTPKENGEDKVKDKTSTRGEKNPRSKITEEIARQIYYSKGSGTQLERATKFGVTVYTVQSIDQGKAWSYLFTETKTKDP